MDHYKTRNNVICNSIISVQFGALHSILLIPYNVIKHTFNPVGVNSGVRDVS